ncbi:MAG: hypothetical protein V4576_01960 [Patescibacteria group bacterium]
MKSKLTLLSAGIATLIFPALIEAAAQPSRLVNPLGGSSGVTSLDGVILIVVNVVQILLIMATVLYLLYAGLMFVTARGEPGKITKARDALLWGMVGAALILGAQVLTTTLKTSVESILK